MSKVIHKNLLYIIYSAVSIAILSLLLINNTFAEDLNYSVSVEPALNITTSSSKVSLDLNPLTHDFDSQDLKVSVSTNNETGYKLYVNTSTTDLIEKNDSSLIIETLDSEVSENDFTVNKWGYKLNTENYLPFKSGTLINSSKVAIENNSSTLTFAAKIDYETKAGTYNLALNFQAIANPLLPSLHDTIAQMSKGKQTASDLATAIVSPTSSATISANSGVYEYDASVFGISSDASNDYPIYYYRGILDSYGHTGTYGSDGEADAYPNYVKIDNTCWRIFRTTGSGGIKMIYNGLYGATTAGSCANITSKAQIATGAYNSAAGGKSIVLLGYTYNNDYLTTTATTAYGALMGSNADYSDNSTDSTIKTMIEAWYRDNLNTYTNYLEPSAGYCNDRTLGSSTPWTTPFTLTNNLVTPYTTASSGVTRYYAGGAMRVARQISSVGQIPTFACATYSNLDRSVVDLYTTNRASDGNKQLDYPIALITADEAAMSGSGANMNVDVYALKSFLHSGTRFWTLTPEWRSVDGCSAIFYLGTNTNRVDGSLGGYNNHVSYTGNGVRPVISLSKDTLFASGNGTASDPWIVVW